MCFLFPSLYQAQKCCTSSLHIVLDLDNLKQKKKKKKKKEIIHGDFGRYLTLSYPSLKENIKLSLRMLIRSVDFFIELN